MIPKRYNILKRMSADSSYSDSSMAASTRRRRKPTAMPIRTKTLMRGTTVRISEPTSHVDAKAPPFLDDPADVAEQRALTFANCCSVLKLTPNAVTSFWALRPPWRLNLRTAAARLPEVLLLAAVALAELTIDALATVPAVAATTAAILDCHSFKLPSEYRRASEQRTK